MIPVAAYVRMSTQHQTLSIENQLAAIETYCGAHGMALVRVYTDVGRSGQRLANRPGLRALLDEAAGGGLPFQAVIAFDVSRWGRFQDADEGVYYEHLMRLAGAPVIYCHEPFGDDDAPVAQLVRGFRRAMAAEYSRDLSRRIRQAQRRLAGKGVRVAGDAGYGYRRAVRRDDGSVAPCVDVLVSAPGRHTLMPGPPAEIAAVRRVFALRTEQRMPEAHIARRMAAEGWPAPPRGWTRQLVRGMLRNEKYAGIAVYGKHRRPAAAPARACSPADWILVPDAWPALVSAETFDAAQRVRTDRTVWTVERCIAPLRALFEREGAITWDLIGRDPALPATQAACKLFGSIDAIYAAAGVPAQSLGEKRIALNRRLGRIPKRPRRPRPGPQPVEDAPASEALKP